jgi:NADH-quinone oxidoreductase subunit I
MLRCIYCGFCEEVCPEEAIVMSKEYDLTFQHRDEAIFGLERLLVPKERLADRLDYLARQRNPQYGSDWSYRKDNNRHSLRDSPFLGALAADMHAS